MSLSLVMMIALASTTVMAREPELTWQYEAQSNLYAPPLVADMTPSPGQETVISDSEAGAVEWGGVLWMPGPESTKQMLVVPTENQGIHAYAEGGICYGICLKRRGTRTCAYGAAWRRRMWTATV